MKVGNRSIGRGHPCFIIAEAGSNHNRDINVAYQLIEAASAAGADAVKFQLFKGERHYSKYTPPFEYLSKMGIKKHIVDILKEIELPSEWVKDLKAHALKNKILFFCSVTSPEDVDLVDEFDLPVYKLASFEIVDLPLIEYMAQKKRPIIFSTGMANMGEIKEAHETACKAGNTDLAFLQCASVYPAKAEIMNLAAMRTIEQAFQVPVGLSDHTEGIHIPVAAVAMGACIIEKHFTLSRGMNGPDHSFAIEPHELKEMVRHIREAEAAVGNGLKSGAADYEREMFKNARRSIHAKINIEPGSAISRDMLTVKRPGYGIKPKYMDSLVGKMTKVAIQEDEAIKWEMLS